LVTTALLLVMVPLVEGGSLDWPAWTFVSLGLSVPAFAVFAWWQRRKAGTDGSPLTEPELFGHRSFVAGLGLSLLLMAGLGSFWFVLVLWLQVGLGFSPLTTAVAGVAWPLAVVVAGFIGGAVAESAGRRLLNVGLPLMALGVALVIATIGLVGTGLEPWHLAFGLAMGGLGMGLSMPAMFDLILAEVPTRHAGSASGVVNTVMQVGSAVGIAVVGVVFFGLVEAGDPTASPAVTLTQAAQQTLWFQVLAFATAGGLSFLLPRRAAARSVEPEPTTADTAQASAA
jgi:predicted MFS family arabinose efflux permease